MSAHVLYECGICGSMHPWDWVGDCRDDANRFSNEEDYAIAKNLGDEVEIEVRSMTERVEADNQGGTQ